MDRKVKIIIIVILVVILLGICVFAYTRGNSQTNQESNLLNEENLVQNTVEENITQENEIQEQIVDDPVEDENTNEDVNVTEPVSTTIPDTTYQSQKAYESSDTVGTTDKKEEAINLVKEYWGPDDTVTYRCDSITTNGEYIIAVTSTETATVKGFFRVNLQNRSVTVEF